MRNVLIIARRELGAFFASPIAYLVTAAFLAIAGYFFS
ncbi:MAG: ABC transporter permease, partial [Chloroflexi bacterium]